MEDEAFEEVCIEGQPIVPQVEAFAKKHNIDLDKGWKVDVAKGVKQKLQKSKLDIVRDEYITKWQNPFNKLNC